MWSGTALKSSNEELEAICCLSINITNITNGLNGLGLRVSFFLIKVYHYLYCRHICSHTQHLKLYHAQSNNQASTVPLLLLETHFIRC